jgi:AhpD family alkylhydroperoxidase
VEKEAQKHPAVIEFDSFRSEMNDKIWAQNNKTINRFFNLDQTCYAEGHLTIKVKEMLGLVSSLVLRCDDCVKYHLEKCYEENVSDEELFEVLAIGQLVGGSIVIPHLRKAVQFWEFLTKGNSNTDV